MAENIIQPNIANAITILVIGAIGALAVRFIVKGFGGKSGTKVTAGPSFSN